MAYYFHWGRNDIMGMTGQERKIWLSQISRIHFLEWQSRQKEWQEHTEYLRQTRGQE